jgi:hypothetical protein
MLLTPLIAKSKYHRCRLDLRFRLVFVEQSLGLVGFV